jgi:hypothetical protein
LVIVDDCTLSGVRFGQFIKHYHKRPIVFAHLYSHPELRKAISAKEPNVLACLGAHDLHDFAPERYAEDYSAWQERWMKRLDPDGYWVGQTEHICFAWNEPDIVIWNSVTEKEEGGWQLLPPERCLKNRTGSNLAPARVQIQAEGKGPLKPSAQVIFASLEEKVVVGNLTTGESLCLSEVAADMWRAILEQGDEPAVVAALSKDYEVEEGMLEADLNAFVGALLEKGLLIRERS